MNLPIILNVIFPVIFVHYSQSDGHHEGKHIHLKIWVPVHKHVHKHTETIIKKPVEDKKIVIHQHHHHHHHGHGHNHGHDHKHKHDHNHKHKHGHDHNHHGDHHDHHHLDWKEYEESFSSSGGSDFNASPEIDSYSVIPRVNEVDGFDEDGYGNSQNTIRVENYLLTRGNTAASDPVAQQIPGRNYKVQQPNHNYATNVKYHNNLEVAGENVNYQPRGYAGSVTSNDYGSTEIEEDEVYPEEENPRSDPKVVQQSYTHGGRPSNHRYEALRQFF
ncbi:hypothetical protein ABEB36_001657 [Hypothenemus hampei]|uniref:Uncharacterized protein n=1 Tax=Hypothenemus hampei TaxID=57062 RepID=A0ABD1FFA1_HYPHA